MRPQANEQIFTVRLEELLGPANSHSPQKGLKVWETARAAVWRLGFPEK